MKCILTIAMIAWGAGVLSGCAATPNGPNDPLTGPWQNATCYGSTPMPVGVASCTVTLEFTEGLDFSLAAAWNNEPAGLVQPRCTTTRRISGQTWSTEHTGSFTLAGVGTATIERTGCVHAADDMASEPTSDIAIPTGKIGYSLTGSTLVISSVPLSGTYTP